MPTKPSSAERRLRRRLAISRIIATPPEFDACMPDFEEHALELAIVALDRRGWDIDRRAQRARRKNDPGRWCAIWTAVEREGARR